MGIFTSRAPGQPLYDGILHNLQVTESVYGTVAPIVIGTQRVHGKLLFYGGFYHTNAPNAGKGLFAGKNDQYVYWADTLILLAGCPCQGVLNVWEQNGKLTNQSSTYSYTIPGGGGSITPITGNASPIQADLGVYKSVSYSVPANDYGAGGATTLTGTQNVKFKAVSGSPSAGQYSFNSSTGTYTFAAADSGTTVVLTFSYQFSLYYLETTEAHVVPVTGPYTITPDNQNYYWQDQGVVYMQTGVPLTKVGGSPSVGQYQVTGSYNTGVTYTFNSADAGAVVYISYEYVTSDASVTNSSYLNFTLFNGAQSQSPWAYMTATYPGDAFGYSGKAYIGANPLSLGEAGSMPSYNYEIIGVGAFAGGSLDANPCDGLNYLLTDTLNGVGFPTANLDSWTNSNVLNITGATNAAPIVFTVSENPISAGFAVGQSISSAANTPNWYNGNFIITAISSTTVTINNLVAPGSSWSAGPGTLQSAAYAYWAANNYFVSTSIDSQSSIQSAMKNVIDVGNVAVVWSAGLLKLIPYGDATVVGNGFTYTPPTTPVVSLTIDDLIPESDTKAGSKTSDDPVQVSVKAPQDCLNYVQAQWCDRTNDYNLNLTNEQNDAFIAQYGFRPESAQTWDFITSQTAATWALNLRLKRQCYIRNTYKFNLPYWFAYLEPMDMVLLPTGEAVRITQIDDNVSGKLAIEAEQWTYGISSVTLYAKQTPTRYYPTQSQAVPGNAIPIFVQNTNAQSSGTQNIIQIGATGQNPNWGGANVYVSLDDVTYSMLGTLNAPSVVGQLSANLASNTDPDTTNTLDVNIALSLQGSNPNADLVTVTQAQADAFVTLCAIVDQGGLTSELISYETATLGSAGFYGLTYLRRGVYGSTIAAHTAGAWFAYLGQSYTFVDYQYNNQYVGQTLYVKLQSFNLMGNQLQSLAQCVVWQVSIGTQGSSVVETYVPTAYSATTPTGNASITNPSYAYDRNFATGAVFNTGTSVGSAASGQFSDFGTGVTTAPLTLHLNYQGSTYGSVSQMVGVKYNIGGGDITWASLGTSGASGTLTANVPAGTNLATMFVSVYAINGPGGVAYGAQVNEIWLQ